MSHAAATHDHDAQGAQGAHDDHDHGHHVTSWQFLLAIFIALLALTAFTVYSAKALDLGLTGNFVLAMFIATIKASLVAAFFMHLVHDKPFNSIVLFYGLLTVACFLLFTTIDLSSRARIERVRDGLIAPPSVAADAREAYFQQHGHYPGQGGQGDNDH